MKDNLLISISTENGTGSQTANKILTRAILSSGHHVNSKNLFPSNIAGLPTNYKLRINSKDYNSFSSIDDPDIIILFNKKTFNDDLKTASERTLIITNSDFKENLSDYKNSIEFSCRTLTKELHSSIGTRKLLYNMLYVGLTAKVIGLDLHTTLSTSKKFLSNLSSELIEANLKAIEAGYTQIISDTCFEVKKAKEKPKDSLVDGNSAMSLGFLDGGADIFTWYPITPSSSVAETFEKLNKNLNQNRTLLQCEDEISAVTASLGAGWAGAKSVTATSGPGLSLMQETIGLGYYTETPFVVADVQRAGPSTGLPTRTAQGDLLSCYYCSHGDTQHPVLLPSNPQEAYDDSYSSLSLAQDLQSPVFVLSDLDLGMNEWSTEIIKQFDKKPSKGKVQIDSVKDFKPYSNETLTSPRGLPRISDKSISYFTRGSGHDEYGRYTEDPTVYEKKLTRLKEKILSGRALSEYFPADIVTQSKSSFSLIYYGSTSQVISELVDLFKEKSFSLYQVRALPLDKNLNEFLDKHEINFVLEQNRDGQLLKIIKSESETKNSIVSCAQFNGLPADPLHFYNLINQRLA